MLKTIFMNMFKLLIAGALIGWLLGSGKLDLKLLLQLKEHLPGLALALILSALNFVFISFRWKNILQARGSVNLPLKGVVKVTWIGQFFSSVLPGSVSGDLVKMLYIQRYDDSYSKKFVFASILIDRVMGLCGLILLVGTSSLFFSDHILENAPGMKPLLDVNYLLAATILAGLSGFIIFHGQVRKLILFLDRPPLSKVTQKILVLWDDLVTIKSKMIQAVLISLVVQFIGVVVFWTLIEPFVDGKMDFIQALAFIPLGLMALALPIAPSGLGVGHAIFQKLFEFSGIANGASLFNLYFVTTLVINLLGVFPYIGSKAEAKR